VGKFQDYLGRADSQAKKKKKKNAFGGRGKKK